MFRTAAPLTLLFTFCTSVLSCGAPTGPSKQPSMAASPTPPADDPTCPVSVPGTTVTVEDTVTGAAFLFVTTGNPDLVRTRATALATMHNDMHRAMGALPDGSASATELAAGAGGGHHHHHPAAPTEGGSAAAAPAAMVMPMGQMISVHSQATASAMDQGARVVFVSSPNDVAQLQRELRIHAQHLVGGTCEM